VSAVYNLVGNRIVDSTIADCTLVVEAPKVKRIALIGSAPSSVSLAPYGDQSWTIWACSPGAIPYVKRMDAWFEIHPLTDPHAGFTPDYLEWMAQLQVPVYITDTHPRIGTGVAYPRDAMLAKYGQYFFTSSLAWMFALALEQEGVEEIGLWGVDMSATEEYGAQRAGCHHFISLARARGITVTVPLESDLLRAPMQYGFGATSNMHRKLTTRKAELIRRRDAAAADYEAKRNEWNFLNGAIDDLEYMLKTWVE
jgi:hypothetical protein